LVGGGDSSEVQVLGGRGTHTHSWSSSIMVKVFLWRIPRIGGISRDQRAHRGRFQGPARAIFKGCSRRTKYHALPGLNPGTTQHCNGNTIYVFLFWELRGLSPNFRSHLFVRDLYFPWIDPHISCTRIGRSIVGIYKSLTDS
jgi:hypothetical protein